MTTGYIYKITNPNNRIYIGQTTNLKERENAYKHGKDKKQKLVYKSILKYGWKEHVFNIIETIESEEYMNAILNSLEKYWIGFYKSNAVRYPLSLGMNLTDGGDGIRGYKHTRETRDKLGNGLICIPPVLCSGVDCYNIDGTFYKSFSTQLEAGRYFSKAIDPDQRIRFAIKEKVAAYNKIWKYSIEDISVIQVSVNNMKDRPTGRFISKGGVIKKRNKSGKKKDISVIVYDTDWNKIKEYDNACNAAIDLFNKKSSCAQISAAIFNKKSYRNYYFARKGILGVDIIKRQYRIAGVQTIERKLEVAKNRVGYKYSEESRARMVEARKKVKERKEALLKVKMQEL